MFLSLIFNLLRYGLLIILFLFIYRFFKVIAADLRSDYIMTDRPHFDAVLIVEKVDGKIPMKKGRSFYLKKQCTVGRAADNDLIIPSPYVSQYHAVFQKEEDSFFIEDLNSTNGTYLNGKRLSYSQNVGSGDRVFIGGVTFQFKRTVKGGI